MNSPGQASRSRLVEQAAQSQKRMERVNRWRSSDDWFSFISYLYWRNRYPVATKVLSKIILFLEIFLIFRLFHFKILASLSLVLFAFFVFRNMAQGLAQYFRVEMIRYQQLGQEESVRRLLYFALASCIVIGISIPAVVLAGCLFTEQDGLMLLFVSIWLVISPIELCASLYWSATYTTKRLRRSFLLIQFFRLLPSIILIVGHTLLGPLAYVLGIFLGRGLENLYLLYIARKETLKLGIYPQRPVYFLKYAKARLSSPEFSRHTLFPIPYQLYNVSLALFLYLRGADYWLIYFVFFHIVALAAYPSLRVAQSMSMDIYLSLKNADLVSAQRFRKKAEKACLLTIVATQFFLIFLVFLQARTGLLANDVFYELAGFAVLEVFVQSLFLAQVSFSRSAANEYLLNKSMMLIFCFAGITIQAFAVLYLRANLQLVYLLDVVFILIAAIRVYTCSHFSNCDIYNRAIGDKIASFQTLHPTLFLQCFSAWRRTKQSLSFIVVQLDNHFLALGRRESLLEEIGKDVPRGSFFTSLLPGALLYAIPNKSFLEAEEVGKRLKFRFGGHLRNVIVINPSQSVESNITNVVKHFEKVRNLRTETQQLLRQFSKITETTLPPLLEQISLSSLDYKARQRFANQLRKSVAANCPSITFDGVKAKPYGRISTEFASYAQRTFLSVEQNWRLVPRREKPYALFSVFGLPYLIVDTTGASKAQKEEIYFSAVVFAIAASVKQAVELDEASTVPAVLFNEIHKRLTSINTTKFSVVVSKPRVFPSSTAFIKTRISNRWKSLSIVHKEQ